MSDESHQGTIVCTDGFKFLRSFQWSPQPDITTYELARCLAVLLSSDPWSACCAYDHLPEECKRHFEVKQ